MLLLLVDESAAVSRGASESAAECDIGKHLDIGINIQNLSREEKYSILVSDPNSDPSTHPRTCRSVAFHQFHQLWLAQCPWVHYGPHIDGVFCRACILFAPATVGGQHLGQFVTKPFKSWVSMTQKLSSHGSLDYHLTSLAKMSAFLRTYENPSEAVNTSLDSQAQKRLEENQHVLESRFKIVMLFGKQGLAFRGHRDDKIVWMEEVDQEENQGNFIEMVRFRAETDHVLR